MTTRYNVRSKTRYGVPGLPSGYDSEYKPELTIPSVGIEDVDTALFNLFDNEIHIQVNGNDNTDLKKVPILFASGEKWALLKRNRPIRDKNNTLILPLITIMRSGIAQSISNDVVARGINQQTGEIVICRKLDKTDRSYQNLINKLYLKNQLNVSVPLSGSIPGQLTSLKSSGISPIDSIIQQGGLLAPDRTNNVYETLVIPSPQFYTATYEIVIWTQYTQHMNQIVEQIMSSFLPQGQNWKIETNKGYWFIASIDGGFNVDSNFDDMSQTERYIKYKFVVNVPAYILASTAPGIPVPIKRYVSSPSISFDIGQTQEGLDQSGISDPFLGADDPTLPLDIEQNKRKDQRRTNKGRIYTSNGEGIIDPNDPALLSLPRGLSPGKYQKIITNGPNGQQIKYIKIKNTNPTTGETIFAPGLDLGSFTIVVIDD